MTMPAARSLTAVAVALATVLLVAGCGDDPESTPPPATIASAPSTTAAPSTTSTTLSAKAELLAAYKRSWEVYADALRQLDASKLATTFAGNALKAAQDEVATQKARNQPVQISVDHRPRVLRITASEGLIEDNYRNHSVVLDPPREPPQNRIQTRWSISGRRSNA
jgi:hypothetical protein